MRRGVSIRAGMFLAAILFALLYLTPTLIAKTHAGAKGEVADRAMRALWTSPMRTGMPAGVVLTTILAISSGPCGLPPPGSVRPPSGA